MRYEGGQYYIKSEEEMKKLFPYALKALENTQKIADRCDVEIEFGVTKLPKYDVPDGLSSWEYLNKLCYEGLERRYPNPSQDLKDRLDYELSVIHKMGYVDYFLIVWDFIHYARSQKIMVGPRIMTLMCDAQIYPLIPVKKEVKATVSGIYITGVKGVRGALETPEKKKGFFARFKKDKK